MKIKSIRLIIGLFIIVILVVSSDVRAVDEPLVNPLNNLDAYQDYEYESSEEEYFEYVDEEGNRQVYFLKGDYWSYTVTDITDREKAVEDFITYINNLSANIIFQSTEQVIFNISTDATVTWWGEAVFEDDYYKIYLIKEWNLVPGETITRKLGGDLRFWSFNTKHTGEKLLSLNISLENGQFVVSDSVNMEIGGFSRRASYSRFMDGENYKLFYLDDIPQETGEHYWTIRDDYLDEVYEVSVTLEEVADLPPVKYGEEIGALRVRGVNFGRVSVEAASEASVNHPLFDYDISDRGDLTAEGDTIFWLPAGHWKVRIIPEDFATLEYCETQLVPVNAGELTILDVPKSLNSSFAEVSGDGLVINKTRELDNHGLITISYSEENTNEILPNLDNTEVYEGGKQAVIKNIQSVADIGNIVLLLDSSGSMRGQMEETLATARNFIQSLPDNINIQVIDFDNEPRLLNGNSKEEVLTKLDIVKADGATALYDSVLEGLAYLSGKDCPNLLLFTDGVDANWDDSGPGSVATKGEVLSAVEESGVPLYTIGFGPGHDDSTLKDLADISDGIYYPADNQTALAEVFTAINASLSQSYQITYNRPDSPALSDTPVVSMVIDTSSSMNMSPETNGCNYRIETVRKLIRNFILNLPEKSLAQLQSFNDDTYMNQIMTDNRALLLHALGGLRTKDGTDILGSVKVAVESLKNVSSSRKILLYITDAALAVDEGEKEVFDDLLVKIKEEDIRVIWVGLGITEEEEAFAHAAELSGGEYLITEDFSLLENKFNDLIQKMSEPSTVKRVPLRVVINEISESGEVKQFADNTLVDFTVTEVNDTVEYPDIVVCQTGLPFDKYNREVHNAVSQEAIPEKEVIVSKRVPLNVTASNQAMEIMVKEAIFLNKLNGIEIPFNKRLIILNMELNNILPEQEVIIYPDGSSHPSSWLNSPVDGERVVMRIPYLINDITSHLFLNYNNSMMYPVSPLTWITEKPIVRPGENSIQIEPEENISGICAFLIDKEAMDQASLHFYDTNYGHISLPLVGEIKQQELALEELPTGTPAVISDSFSLTLTGASDLKEIQTIEVENENVFRVVEGNFTSRVQSLLDINPNKHFHLRLSTGKGDLYIPLNPITALLPYGLNGAVTLAPGSINKARFAFQVPEYLAEDYSAELFIELAGRDVILPIGDIPDATDISDTSSQLMEGDGIKLQVNQLAYYDDMVVADLTLFDSKDGDSTLLDNDAFILVRDDYFGEESVQKTAGEVAEHKGLGGFSNNTRETEYIIRPLEYTEKLLFAGNMPVFDGTNRRVLLLYEIPSDGEEHNWTLQSEYFSELNYEISENEFTEPELLVEKMVPGEESDASFQQKSSEAIYSAIKDYQLSKTLDS
ncbi:MAG: VWA domain-containing protein, partial [Halanaerobiales bacterium]